MMGKFKVGDRVRSLDSGYSICGQIGVVTSVREDGKGYDVEFTPNNSGPLFHYANEVEAPEPVTTPETTTLRDQFAMAALTSGLVDYRGAGIEAARIPGLVAKRAYDIASAMLAERERVK